MNNMLKLHIRKEHLTEKVDSGLICKAQWCNNTERFVFKNIDIEFIVGDGIIEPKTDEFIKFIELNWYFITSNLRTDFIHDMLEASKKFGIQVPKSFQNGSYEIVCGRCGGEVMEHLPPEFCDCENGCDRCGVLKDYDAFVMECVDCVGEWYNEPGNIIDEIDDSFCEFCYKGQLRQQTISMDEIKKIVRRVRSGV